METGEDNDSKGGNRQLVSKNIFARRTTVIGIDGIDIVTVTFLGVEKAFMGIPC